MSDEEKKTDKNADSVDDAELDDLLDSALEDFNKKPKDVKKDETTVTTASSIPKENEEPVDEESWSQDFIKQAADQFERNLQNLIQNGGDGDFGASIQRMAQSVQSAMTNEGNDTEGVTADFQSAISQALRDLSVTAENMQNSGGEFGESELAAMLEQSNLEEAPGEFLPFMQGMMQSLLSKEVLYPSLKDLVEKYPQWLEEKKDTLSSEDFTRYSKQLELMGKVCAELETEKEDDTDEIKKRRFDKTLMLMQEMQTCGHPPEDLIGEQPPLFQSDGSGNPIVPSFPPIGDPQNCCLM
ncbi:peroxisomal biogenesis factor 19 [Leptopilina heterotoma]|uniref:peroxisomal biogenesis factor 19 n=1 Tax=Leptopilina heterotoma TaxID=63436 RepID=UPI001CA8A44A|nr:peroxisomal biogenesis factor 19 [Leptopilina heterotoma]